MLVRDLEEILRDGINRGGLVGPACQKPYRHRHHIRLTLSGMSDTPMGYLHVRRVNLDLTQVAPAQARRQYEPQFPASCLGITRGDAALVHQTKLIFRHRAFQSEQQAIVDELGIVGTIRIDDQCIGEYAKIDQIMSVSAIARQTRSLNA